MRELLDRLREAEAAPSSRASETLAAFHAALGAHLSELQSRTGERRPAHADRALPTCKAFSRLWSRASRASRASLRATSTTSCGRRQIRRAPRPAAGSALPGVEALGPEVAQRAAQATAARGVDDRSLQPPSGEDFLIEPGAGAPQRAREARELAQMIGPKDQSRGQRPYRRRAARRAGGAGGKRRRGGKRPRLQGRRRRAGAAGRARRSKRQGVLRQSQAHRAARRRARDRGDDRSARGRGAGAVSAAVRIGRAGGQDREGRDHAAQAARACRRRKADQPDGRPAPTGFDPSTARQAGSARSSAAGRAFASRAPRRDPARDFSKPARRRRRRSAGGAIRARAAPVRRPRAAQGSIGGGALVRARRLARPRPGAVSARHRCSRRALASRPTGRRPKAGTSRRRKPAMREPPTIWRSWTPSRSATSRTMSKRPNGSARRANSASATASTISRSSTPAALAWGRTCASRGCGSRSPLSRATRTPPRSATRSPPRWTRSRSPPPSEALAKFKPLKPDPAANEVAAPPGGWDAEQGTAPMSAPMSQSPTPSSSGVHQQTPL